MRLVIKAFNFITLIPLTLFCIFHLQLKKFWDVSNYVYTMWNYFLKADNWTFFHTVGWFPYLLSFSCKINYVIGASQMAKRLKKKILLPMQETQVWSLGQEEPLEKETAIHSSILAWEIPWIEKHGSLQTMLYRVANKSGTTYWLSNNKSSGKSTS